jgi:hypothetical protein
MADKPKAAEPPPQGIEGEESRNRDSRAIGAASIAFPHNTNTFFMHIEIFHWLSETPPSGFIFPDGYASRGYTRDNLSKLEQRYFDDLDDSKDPAKAQVILDKFDLCHQRGLDDYEDTTAFVEDRATIEEMLKEKEALAEVRRRECEQNERRDAQREARQEALELPTELPCKCIGMQRVQQSHALHAAFVCVSHLTHSFTHPPTHSQTHPSCPPTQL